MMKLKLMLEVEHWRLSGVVQDMIAEAEKATGYSAEDFSEYDELISDLIGRVADALDDAGHSVEWSYRQSVGVGCILQGPWFGDETKQQEELGFAKAVASCRVEFIDDCKRFCQARMAPVTIAADEENNAEEFWDAFDEAFPDIADRVRNSSSTTIDTATWEAIQLLDGFRDGPSHARDALLVVDND